MLQSIGNICRAIGILAFLVMCYAWFLTSDLSLFLIAKKVTIVFFSLSLVLWLISIVAARRNREV